MLPDGQQHTPLRPGVNEFDMAARRELTSLLKQYGAAEKIVLSPALQQAIAAYTKFIKDRPTSQLVPSATAHILGIARLFEHACIRTLN